MRRVLATLTVAAVVGVLAAPVGAGAEPRPTELQDTFPVAPGIVREVRAWSTPGGSQRVQVLRFRLDDDRVSLRPELAQGQVRGREPVHRTVSRLGPGAVAAVNAGFWRSTPDGDPDGLLIQDGRYVSEPATFGAGPRAAFALFADGSWEVGRPDHRGDVWFPSGRSTSLFGINREVPERQLVALNSAYGADTGAPAGAVEAVFDVELKPNMLATHPVREVRPAGGALKPGTTVLVGRDGWAAELAALQPGDLVTFDLRSSRPWDEAVHALAAGPLLVQDGKRVLRSEWEVEGFQHDIHNDRAHPRTLIAFKADGEVLLVTVDGRQPGASGITTDEAIDLALSLGAVDAVMMDGGGSTTMAVDGRTTNRPSENGVERWVATSLVLRSSAATPNVARLSGAERFATAAGIARHGWPTGTSHAFLASGSTFPDGLAAGPLAAQRRAPLLLTSQDTLPASTRDALAGLGVRTVTVLGGPAAVSDTVVAQLTAMGIAVDRIAGEDRFATAAAVARQLPERSGTALLASGLGFADALAGVVPAHAAKAPLLLTARDVLPEATAAAVRDLGITRVVVAGGPAAVSEPVVQQLRDAGVTVERAAGEDRFTTAKALIDWAERTVGFAPTKVAIAAAGDFPDALAGGAYAAMQGAPVLLSRHESLARTPAASAWLDAHPIDHAYVFGGTAALSTWIGHELQARTQR